MSSASDKKKKYKGIGTRPVRHDGADKVTRRALDAAELWLGGMVHGRLLGSPHHHARIRRIDTKAAEQLPGVFAVATAADFPNLKDKIANLGEGAVNLAHLGANVLAHQKALYKGHAVAAVAAANSHLAEEALRHIKVEYEVLKPVTWVLDAMREDAPLLHDDVHTNSMGKKSAKPSNIATHIHFEKGKVDDALAEADVVVEREFRSASVHQGYIEPHAATALWNEDGHLTIWCSTQGSFTARQQT